ncbi:hypothetical protein WICMUC_000540 [Wickerhamomyces mucosus]|uniref:Anaphase-promoting complex subunit 4 WD40 domain-containing protein n=1 Tax=Wickerhamomyces mucosus TaxID=1378264 RepID=A0A9P8PZI7_9ASCO|nr:hypothetical protein WICMUC_000540 [Wickerhamomyces mucosus]
MSINYQNQKDGYFLELKTKLIRDVLTSKPSAPGGRYSRRDDEFIVADFNVVGTRLAASKTDGSLRFWRLLNNSEPTDQDPIVIFRPHLRAVESLHWKPKSDSQVATVGNDKYIKIWNSIKGIAIKEIDTEEEKNFIIRWSGDSKYILSLTKSNKLVIVDAESGKIIEKYEFEHSVFDATWNNNSSFIFVGLGNGSIDVFLFKDEKINRVTTLFGHTAAIKSLRLGRKAQHLFAGAHDGSISIWSLDDLTLERVIADVDEPVHSIDVTRDGTYIAATYEDGETTRIYDALSGELFHAIPQAVLGVKCFPVFRFLPTKTTYIYSTPRGELFITLKNPEQIREKIRAPYNS